MIEIFISPRMKLWLQKDHVANYVDPERNIEKA